jgi:hypothetical protein
MIPITFLFWNTGGREPLDHVVALVQERRVDVLVLAEWPSNPIRLLEALNSSDHARYRLPTNLSERLIFLVASPPQCLTSVHDSSGVAIRRFMPPIGQDITLVALHLPSKLHLTNEEQALLSIRTTNLIDRVEAAIGHRRTLVMGDFNMNPFEAGLVSSEGFNGVMTRSIALKEDRIVQGEKRYFFYNPMWSLLGDSSPGPPGTYYRSSSTPITFFWNTFDQALMRPDLARTFIPGDVEIIASSNQYNLLTATGIPDHALSDHLPLSAIIRVEEV